MMACVASVVRVMPQAICGVVIRSVRNENGTGGSSPACCSRPSQSIDGRRAGRRAGLEAPELQTQAVEPLGQLERRGLAGAAGRDLLLARCG